MQMLHSYVFNKVLRSAIFPIVFIEIFLIIVILSTGYYRFLKNKDLAIARSTMSFESLSMQMSKQTEQEFENVIDDATSLKNIIEPVFNETYLYSGLDLEFVYDEGFYFINNLHRASVYTTNINELKEIDKQNLQKLYLLTSSVEAIVQKYEKKVDASWINIGSKYSLYYPKIDIKDELSPDLDSTKQSYYFKADKEHNPQMKTIFIPLFNEPWALDLGQIGAVVSPIYKDAKMIGVIGISLTSDNTQKLSEIELPFNAYVLITNKEGYLLFSSNEEQSINDFSISSFTGLYKSNKKESLKIFSYPHNKNSDYLFHEHALGETGLKLILVTKKSEIAKDYIDIFNKTRKLGSVLLLLVLLLHIYLYRKLRSNTAKMTEDISGPVSDVSDASNKLFQEEPFSFEKSDIAELNVLHNNLEKAHSKLINQLYTDAETSLANQKKLLLDIKANDSLVLIRIDNLKGINNIYGPEMGEEVLKTFVLELKSIYKEEYRIYRVDSDVFALLSSSSQSLSAHYEKIKNITIIRDKVLVLLSFTLSLSEPSASSELSLFARAEIALEEAKKQDHLNYLLFDESKHQKAYTENLKWARKFQVALEENRLIAYFQPIYSIKENCVYKFESLVRMIEGDSVILPSFFLGAAARMGKLSDITIIMLKQVFEVANKYPNIEFSINVSFEDFEQADLLPEIQNLMEKYNVNRSNIIFELLETGILGDEKKIIKTISELKMIGCKIAIDDFGTGNSNFAHLMLMQVDYIKIDGQFIKYINVDQQSKNITKTIKAFADMTGAKTIAEFVSEEEIFDVVKSLDIDYAQGYYLCEPRPASDIDEMLKIRAKSVKADI